MSPSPRVFEVIKNSIRVAVQGSLQPADRPIVFRRHLTARLLTPKLAQRELQKR